MLFEGSFYPCKHVRRRKGFRSLDMSSVCLNREKQARAYRHSIQQDCTGSAFALSATNADARHAALFAQFVSKRCPGINADNLLSTVQFE
jgi:hypothetical protein